MIEQILYNAKPMKRKRIFHIIDALGERQQIACYGDFKIDFKASGFQLHTHERGTGNFGHLKSYNQQKIRLNEYELAMGRYYAEQLGFKETKLK